MFIVLQTVPVSAQQPPVPDIGYFQGTVTIGGSPAPDGLKVSARVNGVEYDYAITSDGKYGYGLTQDPEVLLKVKGAADDTVEFFVEGTKALETAIWTVGWTTVNLSVPSFVYYYTVTSTSYNQKAGEAFIVKVKSGAFHGRIPTTTPNGSRNV